MKNIRSWDQFGKAIAKSPDRDRNVHEVLRVGGYFWPQFNRGRLPKEVPQLVYSLEGTVQGAFPDLEVISLESPRTKPDPNRESVAYNGLFLLVGHGGQIGYLDVLAGYPESPLSPPGNVAFRARLPAGADHVESSKRLLQKMWPEVRGVGLAFSKRRERDVPQEEMGDILLTNDSDLVATGYKAFKTLGLYLNQKHFLTAGHMYP